MLAVTIRSFPKVFHGLDKKSKIEYQTVGILKWALLKLYPRSLAGVCHHQYILYIYRFETRYL